MQRMIWLTSLIVLSVAACDLEPPGSNTNAGPAESQPTSRGGPSDWLGHWQGVEGTYLELSATPDGKYEVIVKDLDGPRTFEATPDANHVYFERDGKRETISATDGNATGMKWLAGKSNCLTIKPGEGFCRE